MKQLSKWWTPVIQSLMGFCFCLWRVGLSQWIKNLPPTHLPFQLKTVQLRKLRLGRNKYFSADIVVLIPHFISSTQIQHTWILGIQRFHKAAGTINSCLGSYSNSYLSHCPGGYTKKGCMTATQSITNSFLPVLQNCYSLRNTSHRGWWPGMKRCCHWKLAHKEPTALKGKISVFILHLSIFETKSLPCDSKWSLPERVRTEDGTLPLAQLK